MPKTLSTILSQIERLQKEAASMQSEVIARMKKEIAEFRITPDQLFDGADFSATGTRVKSKAKGREPKYADGSGNTWGGMGKRPDWLRQALQAGKSLEDFKIANLKVTIPTKRSGDPRPSPSGTKSVSSRKPSASGLEKAPTQSPIR
ncbi:MAG: H-NS histone family protein [Alphaproteobacteria bacterium]|nr:MAG: H-NS histone family protein [Alphaproteobacteria bacterium]